MSVGYATSLNVHHTRRGATATKGLTVLLGAATCVLGGFHFWLPPIYGWHARLATEPMLDWALHMLNFSVSLGFVLVGASLLRVGSRPTVGPARPSALVAGLLIYWVGNGLFQWWWPMPVPSLPARAAPQLAALLLALSCALLLVADTRRVPRTRARR